jgi:protein-S-isoprenylcysteine O-methyltransferase Ste14
MPPLIVGAGLAGGTRIVLERMEREYADRDALTGPSIAAMYTLYGAAAGTLAWAVGRHVWPVGIPAGSARYTGGALATAGAAVSLAGVQRFDSASQLSGVERGSLHVTGIYRYSRNPQYLGVVLAAAGLALSARSAFAGVLAAGVCGAYRRWITSEERHLTRAFGSQYLKYLTSTHRWWGTRPLVDGTGRRP